MRTLIFFLVACCYGIGAWQRTVNVAMVEQRPAAAYVISGGFLSYGGRRLLARILIFLLLNKPYQVIFHKVISQTMID